VFPVRPPTEDELAAEFDRLFPAECIQLIGTKQTAIQMHTGNTTEETRGCILVGTRSASPCQLKGGTSKPARDSIKALYGDTNTRPIKVIVLN